MKKKAKIQYNTLFSLLKNNKFDTFLGIKGSLSGGVFLEKE